MAVPIGLTPAMYEAAIPSSSNGTSVYGAMTSTDIPFLLNASNARD